MSGLRNSVQEHNWGPNGSLRCYKITKDTSEEMPDLESHQEEADRRLLLHASHAAKSGGRAVVITSEDTDVFLLCLAFNYVIHAPLFVKCGTCTRTRFTSKVCSACGSGVCKGIPGLHAFTDCDSVSALLGMERLVL